MFHCLSPNLMPARLAGADDALRGSADPLVKRRADFLRCAENADMICFIDIKCGIVSKRTFRTDARWIKKR